MVVNSVGTQLPGNIQVGKLAMKRQVQVISMCMVVDTIKVIEITQVEGKKKL